MPHLDPSDTNFYWSCSGAPEDHGKESHISGSSGGERMLDDPSGGVTTRRICMPQPPPPRETGSSRLRHDHGRHATWDYGLRITNPNVEIKTKINRLRWSLTSQLPANDRSVFQVDCLRLCGGLRQKPLAPFSSRVRMARCTASTLTRLLNTNQHTRHLLPDTAWSPRTSLRADPS